ncbi:MAG: DUF4468 domain-containing protein [Bacteroidaceae bacterium]|nr:DUF4468 domain-containing protein [Bacteroidaceae bacterium]
MKKLMIAMMLAFMPVCIHTAQAQLFSKKNFKGKMEASAYMQGAVPEVNGKVEFNENFSAPGKTKDQIFQKVLSWANLRFMPETERGVWNDDNYYKNNEFSKVVSADKNTGVIVCQADENIVFTNKTLAKDYTRVNYTLTIRVKDNGGEVTMNSIIYTYNLTENLERIAAEDWITDKEAISKKGGLLKGAARFRIKTVDLKNELVKEIADAAQQ